MKTLWHPTAKDIQEANLTRYIKQYGLHSYQELHTWSTQHYQDFWHSVIQHFNIILDNPYHKVCDLSLGLEQPQWLPESKLNIINSCFQAPANDPAIIYQHEKGSFKKISYGKLNDLSNQVANSLVQQGFKIGDAIAIDMPMTIEAVAIYLGIIKAGCCVVSIADSFAAEEIATRLSISKAKGIFTQDVIARGNKILPLYEKLVQANAPKIIVIPQDKILSIKLRQQDLAWTDFLHHQTDFAAVSCDPQQAINILFSSGTTGVPKAIPWTQTTPIKCASDAFFHHNLKVNDRLCWPTNLGWMMGPWLIFAAMLNRASICLYDGIPTGSGFGQFVQDAQVTMLGVVPSMVRAWRETKCMEKLNWQSIKLFSSTGECSNPDDMTYLMSLAGNKPIIEYCGGTEIGGGYLTSTVIEPNIPSTFSTPAMGIDFLILDEMGKPCENGEVALIPPSIGLSTKLLNQDHHNIYYKDMPSGPEGQILRRHGDQIERLANGYFRAHGRVDDTMNLGGIKVSAIDVERVLNQLPNILETAAIAVNPDQGGPSYLVIYAVPTQAINKTEIIKQMQAKIKETLNPLFKIYDVIITDNLPRTATNKVMRRLLRKNFTL